MQKNLNIEKIIFKVVQIKFFAMHINNQKKYMVGTKYPNVLGITETCIILLLAIATNIPVLRMTAFESHMLSCFISDSLLK